MNEEKRKIKKIHTQVDKLATKGREYAYEYAKLIDELIEKGDYSYFESALLYAYYIDISDYKTIDDVKKKTWNEILFQTNSSISKKIKKILDNKKVYQVGFKIFTDSNVHIGDIVEIDNFSADAKYYIHNRQFARLMGTRVTYLEVTKIGEETILVDNYIENASEETNLVNRYKVAIDYLIS